MATKTALIVVDFQQDFCPPTGSLAVPNGLSVMPTINTLLGLPFTLKIATRDWHPADHISFASNHSSTASYARGTIVIAHPSDPARSYETALWPDHCVQNTHGAELVPGLHVQALHRVIDKGTNPRAEMYSAFYDPFKMNDSGLLKLLRSEGITDVFVVGLAADYCVKATAEHALDEGFRTFIVLEGTKPVAPKEWDQCQAALEEKGVKFITENGSEIAQIKA